MTVALPFLLGIVIGYAVRRYWVLLLAPAVCAAIVIMVAVTGGNVRDMPGPFVALLAGIGLALGVFLGRRRVRASASI